MNYNAKMFESKTFNFLKQLICNLILTFCIVLIVAAVIVHFSSCAIYDVLSNSQEPDIRAGDLIVVKKQSNYNVGDIVTFKQKDMSIIITHRIIEIKEKDGVYYYVCHGDNTESVARYVLKNNNLPFITNWKLDSNCLKNFSLDEIKDNAEEIVQIVNIQEIKGKVISPINGLGYVFRFVKRHYLTLLFVVLDVWICLSFVENCLQNKNKFS